MRHISDIKIFLGAIILSFVLYGNTLLNDYALDDAIVFTKNQFTKQGIAGIPQLLSTESFTGFFGEQKQLVSGSRYRPLSLISFALEYELWGETPFLSHLINILLYGCIGYLLYITLIRLLSENLGTQKTQRIALIAALIFLIHPIHTECIANIKGRDEILSLLFSIWALQQSIKYIQQKKIILLIYASLLLFLGSMAKENALTFVLVIPLSIWFFQKNNWKQLFVLTTFLLGAAALFITIRYKAIGNFAFEPSNELMNNPFVGVAFLDKLATNFYTWLLYLKLLIFPHPLTFDYYPRHIPIMQIGNWQVLFALGILLFLMVILIKNFKKKTTISYCILGFALTFSIVSNLVFSVGTFMSERFVFTPSVFWSLALAFLLYEGYSRIKAQSWLKYLLAIPVLYMLIFYPIKTIARNRVWKNDFTLFTTDVKTSSNSAKSNCSAGGKLWEAAKELPSGTLQTKYYNQSEKYLRKAVKIHNTYVDAWLLLGNVLYDQKKDIKGAAICYINVINLQLENKNAFSNLDIVLQQSDDRQLQLDFYTQLHKIFPEQYLPNYRLGVIYGRYLNNIYKSLTYLEKAVSIDSTKPEALKDLGTAYGISQQTQKAYQLFKQLIKLDTTDAQAYINLGIACTQLNKNDEAESCFNKAEQIKKTSSKK